MILIQAAASVTSPYTKFISSQRFALWDAEGMIKVGGENCCLKADVIQRREEKRIYGHQIRIIGLGSRKESTQVYSLLSKSLTHDVTCRKSSKTAEEIDIHALLTDYSERERKECMEYEKEMFFAAAELEKVTIRDIAYQDLLKLINKMISPTHWLISLLKGSTQSPKETFSAQTYWESLEKIKGILKAFFNARMLINTAILEEKGDMGEKFSHTKPEAWPRITGNHTWAFEAKNMWIRIYDMLSLATCIDRAEGMTENVEKAMKLMSVLTQRIKNTPPMELIVDKLFIY